MGAPRRMSATISAEGAVLVGGERVGQRRARPLRQPPRPGGAHAAALLGQRLAAQLEHRLQQEQLLEGQPAPRRGEPGLVLGEVDLPQRLGERRQAARREQRRRQRVRHRVGDGVERQPHGAAHAARGEPLRQGVHRHQPAHVQQLLDLALDDLEERVQHAALERVQLAAHHHPHPADAACARGRAGRRSRGPAGRCRRPARPGSRCARRGCGWPPRCAPCPPPSRTRRAGGRRCARSAARRARCAGSGARGARAC